MARKPTVSLPDVFAKPGAAPARGTPIEALPRDDAPVPGQSPAPGHTGDAPAPGPEAVPGVIAEPSPEAAPASASMSEGAPAPAADPVSPPVVGDPAEPPVSVTTMPAVVAGAEQDMRAEIERVPGATTVVPTAPPVTATTAGVAAVTTASAAEGPAPGADSVPPRPVSMGHGDAAMGPDSAPRAQPVSAAAIPPSSADPAPKATVTLPPVPESVVSKPSSADPARKAPVTLPPVPEAAGPVVSKPATAPPAPGGTTPPASDHGRGGAAGVTHPAPKSTPSESGRSPAAEQAAPVARGAASGHGVALPPERGAAWGIAIAALAVSLTTPFWYDGALRLLGFVPSLHRAQLEDALTLSRQERKLRDVEQRLSTASTQLARTQADLAQANRVQQEAAVWTRIVVLARLAEATRSGRPFVSELTMARSANALGGDLVPLATVIAPYAPIGVPTMDDLARDFRRLTDPVLRPPRGLNPLAWASAAFSYLPFGRPAVDPDPARAALREAAALVEARRSFEAAALLRPLTGPVRDGMAGWLADVDARAAADALDRRVEAAMRPGRG